MTTTTLRLGQRGLLQTPEQPDKAWLETITALLPLKGKLVLDLGCGSGLYSKALADLGAAYVLGLDSAEERLQEARHRCQHYRNVEFLRGNALATGLLAERYDFVLMRALLQELPPGTLRACLIEAYRLLKPGGLLLVQDQTPEDLLQPGSKTHVWGYLFTRYPRLVDQRVLARFKREEVHRSLKDVGFEDVQQRTLWETRGVYPNGEALAAELVASLTHSPLYEMDEEQTNELLAYIAFLEEHLAQQQESEIVAQECWTLWSGRKRG
jgi:ubiquinone/menaquinone biosynthesis C-methylase UbiE